jgi:hypothetical protein
VSALPSITSGNMLGDARKQSLLASFRRLRELLSA